MVTEFLIICMLCQTTGLEKNKGERIGSSFAATNPNLVTISSNTFYRKKRELLYISSS